MGQRVVGTGTALRAAQNVQALVRGDLERHVQEALVCLRTLGTAGVWDGADAMQFRRVLLPRIEAEVRGALARGGELSVHAERVVQDIMRAGSAGAAAASAGSAGPAAAASGAPMLAAVTTQYPLPPGGDTMDPVQLADELKQAIDAGDTARVRQLLQDLAGHENDPSYTVPFFERLGPKYIVLASEDITDQNDLKLFDTALATATNSPDWDQSITNQIFDFDHCLTRDCSSWFGGDDSRNAMSGDDWSRRLNATVNLLRYGTYSEWFLTTAGDQLLVNWSGSPATLYNPAGFPGGDQPILGIFSDALARNPLAAYDYLTGTATPGWRQPPGPVERATVLLEETANEDFGGSDRGSPEAVGRLLLAADSVADSMDRHQALMEAMGHVNNPAWVADGTRGAIATLVANNVICFAGSPGDQTGAPSGWAQTDFQMAEVDSAGQPIADHVNAIQKSISDFSNQTMPQGPLPTSYQDQAGLDVWAGHVGHLQALAALPLTQANQAQANQTMANITLAGDAFGLATDLLPGVPEVLQPLEVAGGNGWGLWLNHEQSSLQSWVQDQANIQNKQLYIDYRMDTDQLVLKQMIANDPGFIPQSVQGQGTDAVNQYLGQLADCNQPSDVTGIAALQNDPNAQAKAEIVVSLMSQERAQLLPAFTTWTVNPPSS